MIMANYFELDLSTIKIDLELARQVPYALSRYYLALPLGRENGRVSVAMTYPENEKAKRILGRLMQAEIVPLFASAESLELALKCIHTPEKRLASCIMSWHNRPELETAVTQAAAVLGQAYHTQIVNLASPELSLCEALKLANSVQYELAVCALPNRPALTTVLSQSTIPLFFVRGDHFAIKRILVVMRGFASDEQALDWLTPFAWQFQATVTLMPLTSGPGLGFSKYHQRESPAGRHLDRCLLRLHTEGVPVSLKFRQGDAVQQVVEEVAGDTYDLLAIAAEAEGDFVSQVLTAIDQQQAHNGRPIFVLKPPDLTSQFNN